MLFNKAGTGFGTRLQHLGQAWFRETSTAHEGDAWLTFPEGSRVPVTAAITITRSISSTEGSGYLICDNKNAFNALNSVDWLIFSFDDSPPMDITVYGVRSQEAQTRCWFEVR